MGAIKIKDKAVAEKVRTILDVAGGLPSPRQGVNVGGGIHAPLALSTTTHVLHMMLDGTDWAIIVTPEADGLYESQRAKAAGAVLGGTATTEQTELANKPEQAKDLPALSATAIATEVLGREPGPP